MLQLGQQIGLFVLTVSVIALAVAGAMLFVFWFLDAYVFLKEGKEESKARAFFKRKVCAVLIPIALATAFIGICLAIPWETFFRI